MLSNALLKSVYTASIHALPLNASTNSDLAKSNLDIVDLPDLKLHCDEEIKLLVFRKSTTFLRTKDSISLQNTLVKLTGLKFSTCALDRLPLFIDTTLANFHALGTRCCVILKLKILASGTHSSGKSPKNLDGQPLGPHDIEFLVAQRAALTSFGVKLGIAICASELHAKSGVLLLSVVKTL